MTTIDLFYILMIGCAFWGLWRVGGAYGRLAAYGYPGHSTTALVVIFIGAGSAFAGILAYLLVTQP